jgi:4-amino-4-deoxy-L-arabinose transferase-like glycosyltransferase
MLKRISVIPLATFVLISLFIKLVFFCYISPWDTKVEKEQIMVSDSWGYEQMAENLLKYHSYAPPTDTFHISNYSDYRLTGYAFMHSDTFRTPLYPTFMATVYFITGVKPYLVIFFQIFLSLISVVLVYRISMLLFKKMEIAKLATLLFTLDIHSAYVANQLLTDTIFVVLFLASAYYLIQGIQTGKLKFIFWGAYLMGLACLTRPVVLFYPAIILVLLLLSNQARNWKFKASLLYLLLFFSIAGSWASRNYAQYNHFKLTTEDGFGMLMYYTAYADAKITHRSIDSVRLQYQKTADSMGFRTEKDIFKQSDIYRTIAINYINKNKIVYIKTHLQGGINMFLAIGNVGMSKLLGWDDEKHEEAFAEINTNRILGNFINHKREAILGIFILLVMAIEYLGAFLGLFYLWKNKEYLFLLLFMLTALYFILVTGVVGTYRYKLAVVPLICIAAGYGYERLVNRKKDISKRTGE